MIVNDWHGCYKRSWVNFIVHEAFAHPAKFSRGLIERIYYHLTTEERWLAVGDRIIDPFGGVALGALYAMQQGLTWVGSEIEPSFVKLGHKNLALWEERYAASFPNWGTGTLLQNDSRELRRLSRGPYGAAVASPPYADLNDHERPLDETRNKRGRHAVCLPYGEAEGQLGNLNPTPAGFDAAISSPPFEKQQEGGGIAARNELRGEPMTIGNRAMGYRDQGDTEGQLAKTDGEEFWTAARQVVEEVYAVLRPGGHAVWVTRDFVRGGERVRFGDQWRQVCEAVGFRTLHRHRALLVERHGVQRGLFGEDEEIGKQYKSFFRILAEDRGSPPIDWEDVWCMEK